MNDSKFNSFKEVMKLFAMSKSFSFSMNSKLNSYKGKFDKTCSMLIFSMSTSFRVWVSKHTLTQLPWFHLLLFHLHLSHKLKSILALHLDKCVVEASGVPDWSFGYVSWVSALHCSWLTFVLFCSYHRLKFSPLVVTFLEHEQQEWYLVTLIIPRISVIVSVVVEISVTSGNLSLNGSASFVVYKLSCFGVFKYLWFWGCWRSRWTVVWRCQHAHPRK